MERLATSDSVVETPSKAGSTSRVISGSTTSVSSTISRWLSWDRLFGFLAESFAAPGNTVAVAAISLSAIFAACGITFLVGLPPMAIYGHDIPGFFDGGWRVLQGQVPHVDFYSALGPIYYFLWAAGFKMAHYRVEGIVYATALTGVVLGIWALAIVRNRFGTLGATACCVLLVSILVAPFAIGDTYSLTTYAMQYNRFGYVLFLLIFIDLFGVAGEIGQATHEWGGLSSGVALGLLLFLKANFFTVALVPLAYAYAYRLKGKRHGVFLLIGFLTVLLPMSWYLHGHLGAYLADLRIAGGARATQKGTLIRSLIRVPSRNLTSIASFFAVSLLATGLAAKERGRSRAYPSQNLVWMLLVLGCDFVLASSNMQGSGLPLTLVGVLLVADQIVRSMEPERRRTQWALAGCLFVVVLFVVTPVVTDLVDSWEPELLAAFGRSTKGARIDAPQIMAMGFKDHADAIWGQAGDNGHLMTDRLNDGIALLRDYTSANERIGCLCFANPFSYALLRASPRGGSPFFDYGFNFSETFAPTAERILGDADVVIYPKADEDPPTIATLLRICGPLLSQKYSYVAESAQWVLLRRRG